MSFLWDTQNFSCLTLCSLTLPDRSVTLNRKAVIIGSLTALLVIILTKNAIKWLFTVLEFVSETNSRSDTVINILEGVFISEVPAILWDVLSEIGFLIADGLMVCTAQYIFLDV